MVGTFLLSGAALSSETLLDKRANFKTSLVKQISESDALEEPAPDHPFKLIEYSTDIGEMSAYVSTPQSDKTILPAIIWITGGHPQGGASPGFIEGGPYKNNQTANMFYQRGVVTMYPTFRGTYGNPGVREEFYGEVNDVLSALKYLQNRKGIDKERIYLGGHSTGATLALLAAAASGEFAGVLALGPQDDVVNHGGTRVFDTENPEEFKLRAPKHHLASIKSPTYIIEGEYGAEGLKHMREMSKNSMIEFWEIKGADHFDVIQSTSELYADAITLSANTQSDGFSFSNKEVVAAYQSLTSNMMRATALQHLARASANGVDINVKQDLVHYFYSEYQGAIDGLSKELKAAKFTAVKSETVASEEGGEVIVLTAQRRQKPSDLEQLFSDQALFERIEKHWNFDYRNWYPKN